MSEPRGDGESQNVVDDVDGRVDRHRKARAALREGNRPQNQLEDARGEPPEVLVVVAQEANNASGQADSEGDGVHPRTRIIGEGANQPAR